MDRLRFVHIPKTAGATFRYILLDKYKGQPFFTFRGETADDLQRYWALSEQERCEIQLFLGHMLLYTGIEDVDNHTTVITFLRDPVGRAKSLCHYVYEGYWSHYLPGPFDLDQFLNSGEPQLFNLQTKFLINKGSNTSSELIKSMTPATARDLALENLFNKVERYGIQEYFDESLMLFCQRFHWSMPFYSYKNRKDANRLLEFKQYHLDQMAELNSIDIEVYNVARKKFEEIMASSHLDLSRLKRFQYLNPRVDRLKKILSRIKHMIG